ncbi:hypothetical protein [Pseudoclavibacter terrae]|uniref:hypothetical protein n=1 Tax=Pseudoclavibacter terrae TaxID=1530195 RepID=UPI00232A9BDC|nr:hypothetical protein [Pseudoclavibacter terrae]
MTLDRLLASPHTMLRKVALTPEVLACGLVALGAATATTRNEACTVHQIGSYDLPSACGGALMQPSAWITLRLRPSLLGAAVVAQDEVPTGSRPGAGVRSGPGAGAGALPSLSVFSRDGDLVHRVIVHSEEDAELLFGLGRSRGPSDVQLANVRLSSLGAVGWREGDQLAQLDAMFGEGARDRHAALTGRGAGAAREVRGAGRVGSSRRVDATLVAAVFEHLSSVGLPVCAGVPSSAVLQLSAGRVHLVERVGTLLVVSLGHGVVELDLAAVRSCLLVTSWGPHGPTSTLEVYDARSECVVVLTQLGIVGTGTHRAWEQVLESLPTA